MTTIFPSWYSRFVTLALKKLCYLTFPTDIFTTQNPGGHVIRSDQWVSPPDNPTTREEKEREPGYEVNLNFKSDFQNWFLEYFSCRGQVELILEIAWRLGHFVAWTMNVLVNMSSASSLEKKSTQAKLKKHKRFLIFLCCTLLFMQGYTAWTPILILSFSVLMHTT